jgi:hypothetical protein
MLDAVGAQVETEADEMLGYLALLDKSEAQQAV